MNRSLDTQQAICATPQGEKIESIASMKQNHIERPNRSVRFLSTECTEFICSDVTTDSISAHKHLLWYQPAEVRKFVADDEILIRKYRSLVRSNQRLGRTKMIIDGKLENTVEDMENEMRGLEDHFTILSHLLHKKRLSEAFRVVMSEQVRQKSQWSQELTARDPFILDADMLRKVFINSSMKSRLLAYSQGQSDASYVRRNKYSSSPVCSDVIRTDIKHPRSVNHNETDGKTKLRKLGVSVRPVAQNGYTKRIKKTATASAVLRRQQHRYINALYSSGSIRVTI